MEKSKLGGRIWFNLIIFGFMGQIAWNVENMYFNTFLYNSVYHGASQAAVDGSVDVMTAISVMVAASAATAVITTFLIGTLSDKLGRRKVFISLGYVLWGLVTAAFGFVSRENTSALFGLTDEAAILTLTVSCVIVLDCVMTFMGSSSNDACFNAWVTDVTTVKNRATAESVLAILPIAAMVAVIALAGVITDFGYQVFFYLLGG
ncbi:MAG TPA: MFS transporter, partial [Clostridiales bacterium]|nr:MFS transporter [Clostridiales bacterium]